MGLKSGNRVSAEFSMSSMTDLVFLLLIFFIIVSTLVTPFAVKMDVPSNSSEISQKERKRVSIDITAADQFRVNGSLTAYEQLEAKIAGLLGPEGENISRNVLLSVEKDVPAGETVKVIVMARKNGWGIAVAGTKEGS